MLLLARKMKKQFLLDHWLAKIVTLALAVTLWAIIKRSIGGTT
jgi:hypothetical protein